jgi:hypothetical protein
VGTVAGDGAGGYPSGGPLYLAGGPEVQYRSYAEDTQRLIDEELDRLTTLLLERETIDGDSVYRLVGNRVSS